MNVNDPCLVKVRGTRREITCSMVAEAEAKELYDYTALPERFLGQSTSMAYLIKFGMAKAQYPRCPYCGR